MKLQHTPTPDNNSPRECLTPGTVILNQAEANRYNSCDSLKSTLAKQRETIEKLLEATRLTADQIGPWIENRGAGKFEPGMITCLDKLRQAIAQAQQTLRDTEGV